MSEADRHSPSEREMRDPGDISLIQILTAILRDRRLVIGLPVAFAVLFGLLGLVAPRRYTSSASFMPQQAENPVSRLSGLAARFGIVVPTASSGESPAFYASLLGTRNILRQTVETRYPAPAASGDVAAVGENLVVIWELEGKTPAERVVSAVEVLEERIRVQTDQETGVVRVSMATRWPELSRQVIQRLLDLVNEFDLQSRQTRAASERRFTGERLREAQAALTNTEDSLRLFLENNRRYENSPQLLFEHQRLQRRVDLRQELVTSLATSYEQARIEEVRNTPVVTIVEPPSFPVRPDPRRIVFKGVLGFAFGGIVALFWVLGRRFSESAREREPEDYWLLTRLWKETTDDLTALWSRLRRTLSSGAERS